MKKRVAILFSGGTIAMTHDAALDGAVPRLNASEVLARTPGLGDLADIDPIDWGRVPASHLSMSQVIDQASRLREALADPSVVGAVVVQGTDVMEETSLAFDLLIPGAKPVVVTGSMRNAGEDGYDGPQNLRAAVRLAAAQEAQGIGCVVVMAGFVLPADDVVKVDTAAYAAFSCPNYGPLGRTSDSGLHLWANRSRRAVLPRLPATAEYVEVVVAQMGSDGALLRAALSAGARGIVVAATGSGNTTPDLLEAAIAGMSAGVPVVLTSRVIAGGVRPAYGFPGGGATWARSGAILAGTMSAPKARIALSLGLGARLRETELAALFVPVAA